VLWWLNGMEKLGQTPGWHSDPWPDLTGPKSLTHWPSSISGLTRVNSCCYEKTWCNVVVVNTCKDTRGIFARSLIITLTCLGSVHTKMHSDMPMASSWFSSRKLSLGDNWTWDMWQVDPWPNPTWWLLIQWPDPTRPSYWVLWNKFSTATAW